VTPDGDPPAVSVVVPTYQRRELVRRAVASVIAQTYRDFELIVIDDGSTDGTRQLFEPLGDQLRYRWQPNRGVAAARNAGLRMSRGSIVTFLDSDDLWVADHLAVVKELMARHPEAVGASTCPEFKLRKDQPIRRARLIDYRKDLIHGASGVGYTPCLAVRREALIAVGGFDERLKAMEDSDLWCRLATLGPFCLLHRRTVIPQRGALDSLRDRGRRAGDYLAADELSAANVAAAVDGMPEPDRSRLAAQAAGTLHLARAIRAVDRGENAAVRAELEAASRGMPLPDKPFSVRHRIVDHCSHSHEGDERLRILGTLAGLWPDETGVVAHYLRAWGTLLALRLRQPREAARLLAGWRLRGSLRFAWEMPSFLTKRARIGLQERRYRKVEKTSGPVNWEKGVDW
jgi:glycosyl transferase family 2